MDRTRESFNEISAIVLDAAIAVHREMGPGLLEAVYQQCLLHEFRVRQIPTKALVSIPLIYKGCELEKTYIADIIVNDLIILELKCVETILPVHEAQIISYLKLAKKRLGFIINFNVPVLKSGFKRFVNGF